jgi:hypothetical protein
MSAGPDGFRFAEAVAAFDRAGAITWTQDQADARTALVTAWTRDTAAEPDATRRGSCSPTPTATSTH